LTISHTWLRLASPPAVLLSYRLQVAIWQIQGGIFYPYSYAMHCMEWMKQRMEWMLMVMTRRRFCNQVGRRPSSGLLLTDSPVFDRARFTPSTAVLLLTICPPIVWFQVGMPLPFNLLTVYTESFNATNRVHVRVHGNSQYGGFHASNANCQVIRIQFN
jgi:hypothetical protein